MRNLIRVGLVILLAAIGGAAAAWPAGAGGPTSVLIVNRQTQQTSSAYTGDPRYERLARYVGIDTGSGIDQPAAGDSPPPGVGPESGAETRLTWLIHDMAVWRVDRVHLTGDAVWIHTTQPLGDQTGEGFWHRAAEPEKLRAALAETGVLRDPGAGTASESSTPTQPAPDDPASSESVDQAAVTSGGSPPGGAIAAGCGLLGAGLGSGATWLIVRHRRAPRADRIVLRG